MNRLELIPMTRDEADATIDTLEAQLAAARAERDTVNDDYHALQLDHDTALATIERIRTLVAEDAWLDDHTLAQLRAALGSR